MIAAASLLLIAQAGAAEEPLYDCQRTAVQFELNECAQAEYGRADDRLNQQWKITIAVFRSRSSEDAERLINAEQAWIAFRDANCWAKHPWDLGVQLDRMLHFHCLRQMTEDRTAELAMLAQDN